MSHHCTRQVRLPADPADPLDLQVNYYDYLARRLIPSTDVLVAGRLAYRTNAVACRGDDLQPGVPVIAVLGGDLVHGPREGGFVERAGAPGFRLLNAGIEGLGLAEVMDRFVELQAAAPLAGAVLVPPAAGLEGGEAAWRQALDRLQGPPLLAAVPLAMVREAGGPAADPAVETAFDAMLRAWCAERGAGLIGFPPSSPSLAERLLRRPPAPIRDLSAALSQGLAAPAAHLLARGDAPAPGVADKAAPSGEAAKDVGRNYPSGEPVSPRRAAD